MPIDRETEGDLLRIVVTQDRGTKLAMGIFFGLGAPLAVWLFVTKTMAIVRYFDWSGGGVSMLLQSIIIFAMYGFIAWFLISMALWPFRHRLKVEVDASAIRTEEGPGLLWPVVRRREINHEEVEDIRATLKRVRVRTQEQRRRFEVARIYADTKAGDEVLLLRAPDMETAGEYAVEIRDHVTQLTGREWPV